MGHYPSAPAGARLLRGAARLLLQPLVLHLGLGHAFQDLQCTCALLHCGGSHLGRLGRGGLVLLDLETVRGRVAMWRGGGREGEGNGGVVGDMRYLA